VQPQRNLYRKSKLASECAPLFTYLLALQHLAVSNSYLIYTTTLRTYLETWSWSRDRSRPLFEVLVLVLVSTCWSWSWSWSRPPWSWSRSRPVWSWSGLGLGLPGLDSIYGISLFFIHVVLRTDAVTRTQNRLSFICKRARNVAKIA